MANDKLERNKIISELDKNLLVSASAGSGKTASLVERMVALVEAGKVKISNMAALTFTKKAAGEFYDRFYKKLQLRTKEDFDVDKKDKYSLLSNPTIEQVKRDKEALKTIDTCFFGTIDAFYQKILNEHPLEAGIPTNSTIISDEEFQLFLIKKFSDYIKSDNNEIQEKAEFFNENIGAKEFPNIMTNVLKNKDLSLYQIKTKINLVEKELSSLLVDFKYGMKILYDNESILRHTNSSGSDSSQKSGKSWDYLLNNFNFIEGVSSSNYKSIKKIISKLKDLRFSKGNESLFIKGSFLLKLSELISKSKTEYYQINDVINNLVNTIIFKNVMDFIEMSKNDIDKSLIESGYLTFDQATFCLLKLLRNEEKYSSTIKNIRSKISCLLIDECQDTDIKQYEIFFRLVADDFNKDFKELTIQGGKLYACGDRKQGIYHFRGADVSTFDEIKELFKINKEKGLPFDIVNLTDNFRSKGQLIQYFNKAFSKIMSSQGYDSIKNDEIKDLEKNYNVFSYESDSQNDPQKVADIILKMVNEEGYSFKDFMVITFSREKICNFAKEFSSRGIPCYEEGYVDINVSSLINVVINIFKYVSSNGHDTISYLEVLSSPLFNFDIKNTIDMEKDYFNEIGVKFDSLPIWPSKLLETIASNKKIIEALNIKGIDVLIGFIHLLKEKENNGEITSYNDAIKYFEELQNKDKVVERLSLLSNDINAVQIANAHKTKGLEKKIVILTKAAKHFTEPRDLKIDSSFVLLKHSIKLPSGGEMSVLENPDKNIGFIKEAIDKEMLYEEDESIRLLYVAATRAREFLFVSSPVSKDGKKSSNNKWSLLLDEMNINNINLANEYFIKQNVVSLKGNNTNLFDNYDATKKSFNIISPSRVDVYIRGDEALMKSFSSREDSLKLGTMVHKLLENIVIAKDIVLDDFICESIANNFGEPTFAKNLKNIKNIIYSGGFTQSECPFDDLLKEVRQYNCYTEVPFSFNDNGNIVNGNIDLIIERDKDVIIIDYKTDVSKEDHSKQLELYKKALSISNQFLNKEIKTYIYNIQK